MARTEQEQKETDARQLLVFYAQETQRYRAEWGIPPDREAHLNAWAAARARLKGQQNARTS